jgi:tetratricopeptide (TPR) repeat protein
VSGSIVGRGSSVRRGSVPARRDRVAADIQTEGLRTGKATGDLRSARWVLLFLCVGIGITATAVATSSFRPWKSARAHPRRTGDHAAEEAIRRGRELLQKGQPRLAIQAVDAIPAGAPQEADALTIRGLALASLEYVGPARLTLEKAWKLQPNAMAAKVLAAIYLSANETDRGLDMLHAAARLVPNDFRPYFAMGESVFMPRRHYAEAATAFRESLKRSPEHWESRVGLVAALIKTHHIDQAEPLLAALLRERPDDSAVLFHAAASAFASARPDDAARYVAKVLSHDPDHREGLLLRARVSLGQHAPREALGDVERALGLAPNDVEALNLLGSIQTALGWKIRAGETLTRRKEVERRSALIGELTLQVSRNPADPEPRWRLGDAAALAGMKSLALQSYQAALALAPTCQQARDGLRKLGH